MKPDLSVSGIHDAALAEDDLGRALGILGALLGAYGTGLTAAEKALAVASTYSKGAGITCP